MKLDKQTWLKILCSCAVVVAVVLFLTGVIGGKPVTYFLQNRGDLGPITEADIVYLRVEAPEATSGDGTVSAKDWAAVYPEIVATMGDNDKNSYVTNYLEEDPYLVNIYEGFGFARDYGSARGHAYTLEDVAKTERPHALANCLTCKTPNFAKLVNDQGVSAYTLPFEDAMAQMEEAISCYTCHGNDAGNGGQITITHSYVNTALGENAAEIAPETLSCGQCHIEYYFTPENKETMMPYSSVAEMTPEAILAYYDAMGFYDWEQPGTGTQMLKAQHPEMETFLQGKHASLLTCADCHMPLERSEDGVVYHSHTLVSPLENETLLASCASCHGDTDMVTFVHGIQDRVTAREKEVGNQLSDLKDALTAAVAGGKKSQAELKQIRQLHRAAQWYFDFCYVENAEGAHNSSLALNCLKTSEELIAEAMELLEKTLPETDPQKLMRQRPVLSEVTPSETKESESPAETDPHRLMRERPELPEELPDTDPERLMRERPEMAEETAETDPESLMRTRPELTETPAEEQEPAEEPAEELPETDPESLMRARPELTETPAEEPAEEPAEALPETDSESLMRTRPELTETPAEEPAEEPVEELPETDPESLMRTRPELAESPAEEPAEEPAEDNADRLMRTRPNL